MLIPLLISAAVLLLLFLILRWLYDRFWQKGLSCRITFTQEYAVEDETSALSEVIVNRKLLPLPVLEISFHMDKRLHFSSEENSSLSDQTYRRDVFTASMRQKITRTLPFKCAGRGYFRINEAGLTARDLFLTKKYISHMPQNTEFYVLPRTVPTHQIQIPYARIMGEVLSRKRVCDDPFEFGGLREYSRGDPMKYINWKATARAGKLLINIHESTLSQRVILAVDMEQGSDFLNEYAVRICCSLCERLLAEGIELDLYSNGTDIQTGERWRMEGVSGSGSLLAVKKKLACLQSGSGLPPVCSCLPAPGDDLCVLISRSQREDIGLDFSELLGKGRGLRVIPCGLGTTQEQREKVRSYKNIDIIWMEF